MRGRPALSRCADRSGDKMIDGVLSPATVIAAARSMEAVQAGGVGGGSIAGAGRKGIGVIAGARVVIGLGRDVDGRCPGRWSDRCECVVVELAQDVVGAAAELARDREAGAVVVDPVGDLQVVRVVG